MLQILSCHHLSFLPIKQDRGHGGGLLTLGLSLCLRASVVR